MKSFGPETQGNKYDEITKSRGYMDEQDIYRFFVRDYYRKESDHERQVQKILDLYRKHDENRGSKFNVVFNQVPHVSEPPSDLVSMGWS